MNAERLLVWLLRLGGLSTLLALPASFLPFAWMDAIHQRVGLGPLPDVPITGYLTRSLSWFYAMHGALWLFLSTDVWRYRLLIRLLFALNIAFGVGLVLLDWRVGMPLPWTLCEGPLIILFSLALLWLLRRVPTSPDER
jgi:hypothetical protein